VGYLRTDEGVGLGHDVAGTLVNLGPPVPGRAGRLGDLGRHGVGRMPLGRRVGIQEYLALRHGVPLRRVHQGRDLGPGRVDGERDPLDG
jgi:hypothetical protein